MHIMFCNLHSNLIKLSLNSLSQAGSDSFLAGDFSVADIMFFPTLAYQWRMGLKLEKYPRLNAYFEKVKQRPAVQASWPPHWKDGPNQTKLEDV